MYSCSHYLVKDNQKLSKHLIKGSERSVYWNKCKTKSENKIAINEYRNFLESNFLELSLLFVLVYLNRENNVKRFKAQIYYLPKGIIKKYSFIINGRKPFMTNPLILT